MLIFILNSRITLLPLLSLSSLCIPIILFDLVYNTNVGTRDVLRVVAKLHRYCVRDCPQRTSRTRRLSHSI
jgi:hypothetical protein